MPLGNLLEETLESWSFVRSSLIEELDNIPEGSLSFRPVPEVRSPAEIGRHLLEFGRVMAGELTRSDGDFTRQSVEQHIAEHAGDIGALDSKRALLDALRSAHESAERRFREVGELHLLQYIKRFDGELGTRLAWFEHGIAHEYYHTGQITVYARLLGLVPALTQKSQASSG